MNLEDYLEDWPLYGEFSNLPDIDLGRFDDSNANTLQCILKCPDGEMLNGSYNSDEVVSAVSPLQGLSPLTTPPTSPSQLNESCELNDLLLNSDIEIPASQLIDKEGNSSSDYDLNVFLNLDFDKEKFQITREEVNILQDALELNKACEALDDVPESPKSVRSHPYKDASYEKHPDKKLRKKQQNKDAAVRYRLKKKAQKEVQGGELEELLELNKHLKSECKEKIREIDYLKELLLDVCKAKGVEPPTQCLFVESFN